MTFPILPEYYMTLYVDSGCSDHMFNTNVQMTNYHVLTVVNRPVSVANRQTIPVLGVG